MTDRPPEPRSRTTIDAGTTMGWAALTVADLQRSLDFYTGVLGFALLERHADQAVLGSASRPLLVLHEQRGARPRPPFTTGLYHIAILLPSRVDLGHALRRILTDYRLDGYADHLVSEALYLHDPDGNGLEIYRDRPRSEWTWQGGQVRMASDPIDLGELIQFAEQSGRSWSGLPEGTTIGHMHLQIGDLAQARAFYHGVLGFDVVAQLPGALFVSAGGYHHHLGLNIWQSRNAPPQPSDAAGLRLFTINVPDQAAQERVAAQLQTAGVAVEQQAGGLLFEDPWHNRILLIPQAAHASAISQLSAGTIVEQVH